MTDFNIHTLDTAPEGSKEILEGIKENIGFVPNLFGVLAESPQATEAYQLLGGLFRKTSLSAIEQNVVWLTINYENNCDYCVPAHTGIAKTDKVPEDVIEALRNGKPIADEKLEALRRFTVLMVQQRGWVADEDVDAFLDAGYTRRNILDVIVGMSHKVISNYTNHFARTPVDAVFKKFAWEKPAATDAA